MNLYEKLISIRKEVISFNKDTAGYGYSYISGSQAISKIRNKMDELGVLLVPNLGETTTDLFNYTNKKGNDVTDHIVSGEMLYVWINAEKPEETLTIPWKIYGQQDDISKAFGSGLTYSERYFILKFFQAPTDELDPDAKDTRGKTGVIMRRLSDKQVSRLFAIAKSAGYEMGKVKNDIFTKYSVSNIADLSKEQYDHICESYGKLKK